MIPRYRVPVDPVLSKFRNRIYNSDDDVFLVYAGKRGSTKSGDSIEMGRRVDRDYKGRTRFYLDQKYFPKEFKLKSGERMPRIIYRPTQLLDMLKNSDKYPIGTAITWDEVGVEGDSRDFATKKNKFIKRTMQTVRSLRWLLQLTAVTIKDYDIGVGRNVGFYIKTMGKVMLSDGKNRFPYGKTKVYEIDVNPTTGKTYYKNFRYRDADGQYKVLSGWYYIKKPPAYMENPYKRYKKLFQTQLYRSYTNELDNIGDYSVDSEMKSEADVFEDKMKQILASAADYFDFNRKKFVLAAVQHLGDIKLGTDAKAKKMVDLLNFQYSKGKIEV